MGGGGGGGGERASDRAKTRRVVNDDQTGEGFPRRTREARDDTKHDARNGTHPRSARAEPTPNGDRRRSPKHRRRRPPGPDARRRTGTAPRRDHPDSASSRRMKIEKHSIVTVLNFFGSVGSARRPPTVRASILLSPRPCHVSRVTRPPRLSRPRTDTPHPPRADIFRTSASRARTSLVRIRP